MGRKWTPEEKQAASERAKAIHEARNKNTPQNKQEEPTLAEQHDPMFGPQPQPQVAVPQVNLDDLLRHIQELTARVEAAERQPAPYYQPQAPTGPQYGPNGMVGTRDKYILDKSRYPDPSERLAQEPRLQRFAFKENYELSFEVSVTQYQTKDGVNTREPKFTLELHRIMFDEETGEPTNGRYVVCRAIFHEDPEAALSIAQEQGVDINRFGEAEFLNEMRYLRMRDWLMEAFYPPRPQVNKRKKEMVIGNRVVEFFEINGESDQTMPFTELDKNKRFRV